MKEHDIAIWAETKSYEELSHDQKQFVLHFMGMEEYDDLHAFLKNTNLVYQTNTQHEVSQQVESNILTAFDNKKKKKRVAFWSIPMHYAAAACLLLMGVTWYFTSLNQEKIKYVDQVVTEVKTVVDTLWIEKITEVKVPQYIVKEVYINSPNPESIESNALVLDTNGQNRPTYVIEADLPDIKEVQKSFGNTNLDADELEQFKVSM